MQQATEAIHQAEQGLSNANDSLGKMQATADDLEKRIKDLRVELDALIDKHLMMLSAQADYYERQLERLPADQETALRPELVELKGKVSQAEKSVRTYAQSAVGEAQGARENAMETLQALRADFDELEQNFQPQSTSPQ